MNGSVIDKGSREYALTENVLVACAKRVGLDPIVDFPQQTANVPWHNMLDPLDQGRVFRHLKPSGEFQYSGENAKYLEMCSGLYAAFVLQKK